MGGNDPTLPVQSGAIPKMVGDLIDADGERQHLGHCSFSSDEVERPIQGDLYA
jgi:hypothetical protein